MAYNRKNIAIGVKYDGSMYVAQGVKGVQKLMESDDFADMEFNLYYSQLAYRSIRKEEVSSARGPGLGRSYRICKKSQSTLADDNIDFQPRKGVLHGGLLIEVHGPFVPEDKAGRD